jgi:hypothetical protein
MPHFYLHLRDGDRLIEDQEGSELPDLDAARQQAMAGAREILAGKMLAGEVVNGQRFEITDEAGVVVCSLPLKEALKLS